MSTFIGEANGIGEVNGSEYVKGALPLDEVDAEIAKLSDALIDAKARRAEIINAKAVKVAKFQVGDEFEDRRGVRFKITSVTGDYQNGLGEPMVWVRYHGHRVFKKGTTGRTERVYPKG